MKDIFGTVLLDYFNGNYSEDIITETSISEEDIVPLPFSFQKFFWNVRYPQKPWNWQMALYST